MLLHHTRIISSLALLFLTSGSLFAQIDCDLKKDQDSIKVYACDTGQTKFKSIKASFEVNASAQQLVAMVMDIPAYDQWQYKTINPKILKVINKQELIYYVEVVSPWPISNRDLVVHLKIEQNPLTKIITVTTAGLPDYIPQKEGITRVPMSKARWLVVPLSPNKLKVEYWMNIDPSGSLPAWMMNLVSFEGPFESFYTLKNIINDRNYTKTDTSFILN